MNKHEESMNAQRKDLENQLGAQALALDRARRRCQELAALACTLKQIVDLYEIPLTPELSALIRRLLRGEGRHGLDTQREGYESYRAN